MHRTFFYYTLMALIWALYMCQVLATYVVVWLDRTLKFRLPFPRDVDALAKAEQWCIGTFKIRNPPI